MPVLQAQDGRAPIRLLTGLGAIATALVGLWCVKRGRVRKATTRTKSPHEIWQWKLVAKATSELKAKGLGVLTLKDEEEAVALITRAFSGSATSQPFPVYDWLFGPELRGKFQDPLRINAIRFSMLRNFRNTVLNGGVAIGVRCSAASRLVAVCLAFPYIAEDGSRGSALRNQFDMPAWPLEDETKYGRLPKIRALRFALGGDNLLDQCHDAFAPGPHWWIKVLAADPDFQGQGHAKRALDAVHDLAKGSNVPCYLDTAGERLRSMYERFGYIVAGGRGFELNIPGDPDPIMDAAKDSSILRLYGLTRSAH